MSDNNRPKCETCVEYIKVYANQFCRRTNPWSQLYSTAPACSKHKTWLQSRFPAGKPKIVCLDDYGNSLVSETSRIRGCHWPADGRPRIIDSEDFLWYIDHHYGHFAPSADYYPVYDIVQGWIWRKVNIIRYSYLNSEFCTPSGKLWAPNRRIFTFEQQPAGPDDTAFRRHSLKPDWHPFPHRNRVWMDRTGQIWEAPTDKAQPQYIRCNAEGWLDKWVWIE